MGVTGLHLLLTYECNLRCRHCFVWGSPHQSGTMRTATVRELLDQADAMGTVEWICFEGGEPFLHYGLLLDGVRAACAKGYRVGVVTNAFWAVDPARARARLQPLAGKVEDLSISTDLYHSAEAVSGEARCALAAAEALGIPADLIRIAQPGEGAAARGQIPAGESAVVYRGRAAEALSRRVPHHPADRFDACPHEALGAPDRVHIDPGGFVHVCQGIVLGNCLEQPLKDLFSAYEPNAHPIVGPLLRGGPAGLAEEHGVDRSGGFADACHLCFRTRCALRARFPAELGPDAMYGDPTWRSADSPISRR